MWEDGEVLTLSSYPMTFYASSVRRAIIGHTVDNWPPTNLPNNLALVPPPPTPGSAAFAHDIHRGTPFSAGRPAPSPAIVSQPLIRQRQGGVHGCKTCEPL